ncbi:RNA-directed DNA polymerase [Candidatus Parcubacteria bacterium]|nr:RNA-directed DNA polymerase [Candidatus Parcubacteria bacterium]
MQQAELPLSPNNAPWPDDFRTALGLDEAALAEAWMHRADYRPHRVPKRKARRIGPKREPRVAKKKRRPIDEPHPALRVVQEAIRRKLLEQIPLSACAHGFRKGRSAKTALLPHRKSTSFFTVDFRNAFHKVTGAMLAEALRACTPIIKPRWVAPLVAFTTHRGRLPQGAPTSNDLFNIACRELDANLAAFAQTRGFVYTRYADAVIISAKAPLPTDLQREIEAKIRAYGFPLAAEKTGYTEPRYAHPVIMGIAVVDGRLRVPRRQLDRARAFLHRAKLDPTIPMEIVEGVLGNVRGLIGGLPPRLLKPYKALLMSRHLWVRYRRRRGIPYVAHSPMQP